MFRKAPRRWASVGLAAFAVLLAVSVNAFANPISTIGSKTKHVAVAAGHGAKKVVLLPVKAVEHIKNAF